MRHEALLEQYFTAVISGDRSTARELINELIDADCDASQILIKLVWPTAEQVHKLHRADQLSEMGHHFATRLMRHQVDQLQMRLVQTERRNKTVLLVSGPEEQEELYGQIACDLMEADGYDVYYAGGGIANDEIVAQVGQLNADILVVFGADAKTVPFTRMLIDRLHEIGVCPKLQINVGGGIFNRAEGLAEEIGADLWANDPLELVELMDESPEQRMSQDQRTVGRKRRKSSAA